MSTEMGAREHSATAHTVSSSGLSKICLPYLKNIFMSDVFFNYHKHYCRRALQAGVRGRQPPAVLRPEPGGVQLVLQHVRQVRPQVPGLQVEGGRDHDRLHCVFCRFSLLSLHYIY